MDMKCQVGFLYFTLYGDKGVNILSQWYFNSNTLISMVLFFVANFWHHPPDLPTHCKQKKWDPIFTPQKIVKSNFYPPKNSEIQFLPPKNSEIQFLPPKK